jgi:hypothetical protein
MIDTLKDNELRITDEKVKTNDAPKVKLRRITKNKPKIVTACPHTDR